MRIGVDFDNTIASYDKLIYDSALKRNLIPPDIKPEKKAVRDYLRKHGKENSWIELQGFIYGKGIIGAQAFSGVLDFFSKCKKNKVEIYIISHKTKYPFKGPKYDLHESARIWLRKNKVFENIAEENVFLELTIEEKLDRVKKLKCDYFIDDLPEVLEHPKFPKKVKGILFDPNKSHLDYSSRISNWSELNKVIDGLEFLKKNNINDISLIPLNGGRNNRIFRAGKYKLKIYFTHQKDTRNRLKNEFSFSKYAWKAGIRNIPEPIAADFNNNLGIYSFIEGNKIEKVTKDFVDQAVLFFLKLNENKEDLPNASDACFSAKEHLDSVSSRLDRLKKINSDTHVNKKTISFVAKLRKEFDNIKFIENIETEKIISPSDFGFHNALEKNGKITFLDFEYAGLDSKNKMICDFFCQPEVPVPIDFLEDFVRKVGGDKKIIDLLLPLYRIKWNCIMLNPFLSIDSERIEFSRNINLEEEKRKQLEKAINYFEKYKN